MNKKKFLVNLKLLELWKMLVEKDDIRRLGGEYG